MSHRLLIIEDDAALSEMLALHFEDAGFTVACADTGAAGVGLLRREGADLVLLDQQLPDGLGRDLIGPLLAIDESLPILMMTGRHDLELAIDAIQAGAAEFVHKPVDTDALQRAIHGLLAQREAAAEEAVPAVPPPAEPARDLIGRSAAMLEVSKAIALSARSTATVLISGESGTGKEVVARLIHQHSGRRGPFIAVNCAAIVDTLLESELFGHEKGAFTGAQQRKRGRFEQAAEGTLFLDEIGELAAPLQAKLLRAIQERVFERVGGSESIATDARIVAATNRDLLAEAAAGRFRDDLAYRLQVIEIRMPPLRERPEDIPMLAEGLLARIATRLQRPCPRLSDAALARLQAHDWPGNVRELENLLTRALLAARQGPIMPELLGLDDAGPAPAVPADTASAEGPAAAAEAAVLRTLDSVEAEHIQRVLDHTDGHKGRSSQILGISRPALDRKIKKYGLRVGASG